MKVTGHIATARYGCRVGAALHYFPAVSGDSLPWEAAEDDPPAINLSLWLAFFSVHIQITLPWITSLRNWLRSRFK